MENIRDSCLICLTTKENDFDHILTTKSNNFTCKSELALMYEDVFNLEINEEIEFPQYLCPCCALQLKLLSKFKKKAHDSYKIIYQKNCSIKKFTEDVDNIGAENTASTIINKNSKILDNNHNDDEEIITTTSISPAPDTIIATDCDDLEVVIQEIDYDDFNSNNIKTNDDEFLEVQFLDNVSIKDSTDNVTELEKNVADDQIYDDITILSNISSPFMEEEEIYEEYTINNLTNDAKLPKQKPRKYTIKNFDKSDKKMHCTDCNIKFFQKLHLVEHRRDKHPTHSCEICSKRFLSPDGYNSHMKIHMGLPGYKCEQCGKTFNQKQHLLYHTQNHHSNERNFECELCSKRFVAKGDLKIHLRVHNDERRYECDICNRKFRAHTHMTNHRYSHFEKCLECPHCHLKYASPSSLKTHIRSVHEGLCPHECIICQKKFKRRHHLLTHLKTHQRSKKESAAIKEDIIVDGYVILNEPAD